MVIYYTLKYKILFRVWGWFGGGLGKRFQSVCHPRERGDPLIFMGSRLRRNDRLF